MWFQEQTPHTHTHRPRDSKQAGVKENSENTRKPRLVPTASPPTVVVWDSSTGRVLHTSNMHGLSPTPVLATPVW